MIKLKQYLVTFLALCLCCSLLACGAEQTTKDLTIRTALGEVPTVLDPAMATTEGEKTLIVHLFENLMKSSENGPKNACAKSYTCTDNLDGTETYEFKLRDDIFWSDGEKVTANDFVYTWKRLVSPDTNSPNAKILSVVAGFEEAIAGDRDALQISAPDDETVIVKLNCHCPYFISSICTSAETMPVNVNYARRDGWSTRKLTICTNGAYEISDWSYKKLIAKEKDKYYDTRKLGPETLEFLFFDTDEEAIEAYLAGDADYVIDIKQLPEGVDESLFIDTDFPVSTILIVNAMSSDLLVNDLRQAMTKVINRSSLIDSLTGPHKASDGIVPYGIAASSGGSFRELSGNLIDNDYSDKSYEEECDTAVGMLSNVIHDADGTEIPLGSMNLLYRSTEVETQIAQYLIGTWQEKLGITITATSVPTDQIDEYIRSGEFSMILCPIHTDVNDAADFIQFFSKEEMSMFYPISMYSAYNMLMRAAAASVSTEARDAYYADAEQLLVNDSYVVPLCSEIRYCGLNDKYTGIFDDGIGVHFLAGIHRVINN